MPRFAANLTMMYAEYAFADRIAAAARDGFVAAECLFPYDLPAHDLKSRLDGNGVELVLFNAPPGDWAAGERGIASLPGREDEFRRGIDQALDYARTLGTRRVHVMAGLRDAGTPYEAQRECYLRNLAWAASQAQSESVTVLIEPINPRDMPGYLLNRQDDAQAIRAALGAANLLVQFDCYHCQIVEGDLAMKLRRDIGGIGHVQIAGVPQRHEPDTGEVNYPYLFALLDELGYGGWIGCEYRPRGATSPGLGWVRSYLSDRS